MNKSDKIVVRVIMALLLGICLGHCYKAYAGPLVSEDHSTLRVSATNCYYWEVEVNGGPIQRIDAIRDTEKNIGKLELDIRDTILSTPGHHVVRIAAFNSYGTTAKDTPIVYFDVEEDGTFSYRCSPIHFGIKLPRITDLIQKEE